MINAIRVSTVSMFQFSEGRLGASMGCLLSCCCGSEDDETGGKGGKAVAELIYHFRRIRGEKQADQ